MTWLEWLEATRVADAVRNSVVLTAGLSAVHLLGFTLVTGGALVANLRLLGVLLARQPLRVIVRPATRGIAIGLLISVVTGGVLFSTRATTAAENGIFQTKMTLLASASLWHLFVQRRVRLGSPDGNRPFAGLVGLTLWMGLALAGCAFILLE